MTEADIYDTDILDSQMLTTAPMLADYTNIPDEIAETLALKRLGLHRVTSVQAPSPTQGE
ncbi:hypothetical protein EXS65_02565 [Candidatus Peribacteria bacterium]|nr:hypothetical protein [Candidatus Peribacteria bacterium]